MLCHHPSRCCVISCRVLQNWDWSLKAAVFHLLANRKYSDCLAGRTRDWGFPQKRTAKQPAALLPDCTARAKPSGNPLRRARGQRMGIAVGLTGRRGQGGLLLSLNVPREGWGRVIGALFQLCSGKGDAGRRVLKTVSSRNTLVLSKNNS